MSKKMTKYIHYTKTHATNILISNNVDESVRGYTLGLEIEADCFDKVLKSIQVTDGVPFDITKENIVTNANISAFKSAFLRCMDTCDMFTNNEYSIRELHENCVTWYTKKILPRL